MLDGNLFVFVDGCYVWCCSYRFCSFYLENRSHVRNLKMHDSLLSGTWRPLSPSRGADINPHNQLQAALSDLRLAPPLPPPPPPCLPGVPPRPSKPQGTPAWSQPRLEGRPHSQAPVGRPPIPASVARPPSPAPLARPPSLAPASTASCALASTPRQPPTDWTPAAVSSAPPYVQTPYHTLVPTVAGS